MTRFVAVGFVVLASLAGVADAQTNDALPNGAILKFEKFYIRENGGYTEANLSEQQDARYLNLAHCTCAQMDKGDQKTFAYDLSLSADVNVTQPEVKVYVGENCQDSMRRQGGEPDDCKSVGTIPDINTIKNTAVDIDIEINTYEAINANQPGACRNVNASTIWLLFDRNGDTTSDHWVTNAVAGDTNTEAAKGIDVQPPEKPIDPSATGGESSITVRWDPPTTRPMDFYAFQALCSTMDDQPVFPNPADRPAALYQRTDDVCPPLRDTVVLTPVGSGGVVPPAGVTTADPTFLCGEKVSQAATSLTIEGLENGKPYKVALVAIDFRGNYSGVYFTQVFTPQPVTDFWEDLNDHDSAIDGGCLLSKTYGDGNPLTQTLRAFRDDTLARTAYGRWLIDAYYATIGKLAVEWLPARILIGIALVPFVAIALLWHFVGLPIVFAGLAIAWLCRRHRSLFQRRWIRAAAVGASMLIAPSIASAQTDPESLPFIVNDEPSREELGAPPVVKWIAGIRVGPYIPDIDLQFGRNGATGKGPYEAMFGDYYLDGDDVRHDKHVWQVLPMLDVARVIWSGSGQLAVGGSLGYMQKTAYAYLDGSSSNDPMRPRSDGSKNTFRLIPFSANLTYRFTQLDDLWGIPVVPYLRGGLSYYMWWMTGPKGDISNVDGDKAYGGTPGVEGAAGLAIRAERVDADSARSMRNSGLQHAGFYGEVSWARVDGFDSSSKLWVGDTTWFAGVLFEF